MREVRLMTLHDVEAMSVVLVEEAQERKRQAEVQASKARRK